MDSSEHWKTWFRDWPEKMPRQGVLVTIQGDQIPFKGFLTGDEMLLLQRTAPDSAGTRQVLLPYHRIDSLKLIDVVDPKIFSKIGFEGSLPKR
jgi:hypothetical protein